MSESDPFDELGPLDAADADLDLPPLEDTGALAAQLAVGAGFDLNDMGNGQRFALYFGQNVLFVPRVGFYVWNGMVWEPDRDEIAVRRLSQQMSGLIKREVWHLTLDPSQMAALSRRSALADERALLLRDVDAEGRRSADADARVSQIDTELKVIDRLEKRLSELRSAHRRFAIQSGNKNRMEAMRGEAAVRLARKVEEIDAGPLDINTLSGLVRLRVERDGARRNVVLDFLPHDRGHLCSKIAPVHYDPDAGIECPTFDAFMRRILPDPAVRAFLMRWFALGLTGLMEQRLVFLYGMGANGKSVLVDLMARIAGDYAATAKIESLTGANRRGGGDATPDLVPLIGARMVRAAEPDEGVRWQEGLIKDLTGGEPILVRALHSDFVEVRPCFSLTISGNHKPDIRGTDDGIWRRLILVPFEVQIPREEQIPKAELDAALYAERDGIFARLIESLREYLEIGLAEPEQVLSATLEFRQESDPYGTFLDEACTVTGDPTDTILSRELTNAFHFWMMQRAEGAFRDRTVSLALKERSRRWVSKRTGQKFTERKSNGQQRYDGIRFTDIFRRQWEAAPKDAQGRAIGAATYPGPLADGAEA